MTLEEKEIRTELKIINDEIGEIRTDIAIIKNNCKWFMRLIIFSIFLSLTALGINLQMPAPFLSSGLAILFYGVR